MKMKITIIALIIGVIFIGVSVFFVNSLSTSDIDFSIFNEKDWNDYPKKRHEMILDFEQRYPVDALTKETVVDLLGDKNMTRTSNMYSYYIGRDSFLNTYYAIIFDEQGQCINRYIYND